MNCISSSIGTSWHFPLKVTTTNWWLWDVDHDKVCLLYRDVTNYSNLVFMGLCSAEFRQRFVCVFLLRSLSYWIIQFIVYRLVVFQSNSLLKLGSICSRVLYLYLLNSASGCLDSGTSQERLLSLVLTCFHRLWEVFAARGIFDRRTACTLTCTWGKH